MREDHCSHSVIANSNCEYPFHKGTSDFWDGWLVKQKGTKWDKAGWLVDQKGTSDFSINDLENYTRFFGPPTFNF